MTTDEVKVALNLSNTHAVLTAIDCGILKAVKRGGKWDIDMESVEAVKKRREMLLKGITLEEMMFVCGFWDRSLLAQKIRQRIIKAELVKDTLLQVCSSYRFLYDDILEYIDRYLSGNKKVRALARLQKMFSSESIDKRTKLLKQKKWYRLWKGDKKCIKTTKSP